MEKYQLVDHRNKNSSKIYFLTKFGEWFVKYIVKVDETLDYHFLVSSLKEELHQDK